MATTATIDTPDHSERTSRRRPFASWMKKLANFKPGSSTASTDFNQIVGKKRTTYPIKSQSKKTTFSKNTNPYSEKPCINDNLEPENAHQSTSTLPSTRLSQNSLDHKDSGQVSEDGTPTIGNKSTIEITADRANSIIASSNAPSSGHGTNGTAGYGLRGNDSTFSSPAPSIRSLTTTLTTLHSAAPTAATTHNSTSNPVVIQFSHQFPTSSPLNAIPSHMASQSSGGHPSTYNTATANNLLTDNASILTLASSSKRRRRRSIDTDASVRALAPSSLFGGSRESLPLSFLSANVEPSPHHQRPSIGGLNERGSSMYSVAGVVSILPSERSSYYAGKQQVPTDAANVMQNNSPTTPRDFVNPGPGKLSQCEITPGEGFCETEMKESGELKS